MSPAASTSGIRDHQPPRGSVADFLRQHLKAGADWDLVTANFQGGYFPANKQFIEQLPIALVERERASVLSSSSELIAVTRSHLADHPEAASARDPLMVAYWEQVLNKLVYELYFPEELHAAGLRLFDLVAQADLPDITPPPEKDRVSTLRKKFEELYDASHPLKVDLQKLQTFDLIRIIEGKA